MRTAHGTSRRRLLLVWGSAAAVIAFAVLASLFLIAMEHTGGTLEPAARPSSDLSSLPPVSASTPPTSPSTVLPSLPKTADPDVYAEYVAALVLGLDTRGAGADDYRRVLRAEADPNLSDSGRADLFATIDARIPSDALWARMRRNGQWSQWSPSRVWEPAAWSQVVTGGYAEPGWVMRNVAGTQTTHYVEATAVARSTSREPTLTVVMRCPAPGAGVEQCTLVLISTTPAF